MTDCILDGKSVLITGAGRGIGRGLALAFAEAGADVALCGRRAEYLEPVASNIRMMGRKALVLQADASVPSQITGMVDSAIVELGGIDILINNAVIYSRGNLVDLNESDWDKTFNTGLRGYYLCASEVARRSMIPRKKGCIICMSSTSGIRATPGQGAYSIIKAADIMMVKLLALELAEHGIRVNALAPSFVRTEDARRGDAGMFVSQLPFGRMTEMQELAAAALFLASDDAGYISGHTLVIDGGRINSLP